MTCIVGVLIVVFLVLSFFAFCPLGQRMILSFCGKKGNKKEKNNKQITTTLYYADFCGGCRHFKPIWKEIKKVAPKNVTFKEVNCKEGCKYPMIPTVTFDVGQGEEVYDGERSIKGILSQINLISN